MEGSTYRPTKALLDSLQKNPLVITVVNCLGGSGSTTLIYRFSENEFVPVTVPTTGVNKISVPNFTMYLSQAKAGLSGSSSSSPVTSVAAHPPATTASTLLGWGSSLLSSITYPFSNPGHAHPQGPYKVPLALVDVSGQDGYQRNHPYFAKTSDAMIFTLDATRRDEDWNKHEQELVERLLMEIEDQNSALLLLVNKMDRQDARSVREVMKTLRLDETLERYKRYQTSPSFKRPPWLLMGCSVKTGEGIQEGMEWIVGYALEKRARASR